MLLFPTYIREFQRNLCMKISKCYTCKLMDDFPTLRLPNTPILSLFFTSILNSLSIMIMVSIV